MSWKSLITAGVFCVLASPAFAVGPDMGIISTAGTSASGHLNAAGNWVWTSQVTPDLTIASGGSTPVGTELGYTSSSTRSGDIAGQGNLISVANANPSVFDTDTPGNQIFTWETLYGSPAKPEGLEIDCTGCTATNTAAFPATGNHPTTVVAGTANQIFAALGSAPISSAGAQNILTIEVNRPVVTSANVNTTTTIQVSGAYTGKGRIAQSNGSTTTNYDTFGGTSYSFTMNARGGDTDLNGSIQFADYSTLIGNYNQSGKTWQDGDFTGEGTVSFADYSILIGDYNQSYTVGPTTPGAGAGLSGGGAVPEPASIALLGLAFLGGLGAIRRKR